jgi:hypothetical protein
LMDAMKKQKPTPRFLAIAKLQNEPKPRAGLEQKLVSRASILNIGPRYPENI